MAALAFGWLKADGLLSARYGHFAPIPVISDQYHCIQKLTFSGANSKITGVES
jgi:hypothetical protein